MLLHVWISVFGNGEGETHGMSVGFAAADHPGGAVGRALARRSARGLDGRDRRGAASVPHVLRAGDADVRAGGAAEPAGDDVLHPRVRAARPQVHRAVRDPRRAPRLHAQLGRCSSSSATGAAFLLLLWRATATAGRCCATRRWATAALVAALRAVDPDAAVPVRAHAARRGRRAPRLDKLLSAALTALGGPRERPADPPRRRAAGILALMGRPLRLAGRGAHRGRRARRAIGGAAPPRRSW